MTNEIFEKNYTYDEIFENLKDKNTQDFVKIFSVISIDKIEKQEDFIDLINCLTNHSTPIREITAIKLEELSKTQAELFINDFSKDKILKGIIDINPNVSRAVCSIIQNIEELQVLVCDGIINEIKNLIESIRESYSFCDKNNKKSHAKNKKIFALYWYLEALSFCKNTENNAEVLEIIKFALDFYDYTIREKGAKILAKFKNSPSELLQKAKSDQNFYVKNLVYGKIYNDE